MCLFIFRFRPISVFRQADEDQSGFMCCAFSARERFLMLGTCTGQLKLYNVFTGQEEASYNCHNSVITNLEPSRVGVEGEALRCCSVIITIVSLRGGTHSVSHCYWILGVIILSMLDSVHRGQDLIQSAVRAKKGGV